nr:MAG: HNH endonuclease [Lokiarchaeota virus Ratatoskr Meg22_1012]
MKFNKIYELDKYCKDNIDEPYCREILDEIDYDISGMTPELIDERRLLIIKVLDVQERLNASNIHNIRMTKNDNPKGFTKNEWEKRFKSANNFYNSKEWAKCRIEILKRDNYTCKICGKKPARNIHHINSVIIFPEMSLSHDNLLTVCDECHKKWHGL